METRPLVVHCCHCRWCQRESGSAFAVNAMIEHDRLTQLGAAPDLIDTPSESGRAQLFARCPKCKIAVWSDYGSPRLRFVRVGTLDQADLCPPDVHIYTGSKQPWVVLSDAVPVKEEYYEREEVWSEASMKRWNVFQEKRKLAGKSSRISLGA